MASSDERKLELEKKKQRLAEIREEKRRREEERRRKMAPASLSPAAAAGSGPATIEDVEHILSGLDIPAQPFDPSKTPEPANTSLDRARTASPSPARLFTGSSHVQQLSKSEIIQVDIAPKDSISYSKTTQTDGDSGEKDFHHTGSLDFVEDDYLQSGGTEELIEASEVFNFDESPTHLLAGLLPHISLVKPAQIVEQQSEIEEKTRPKEELTDQEKATVLGSAPFQTFFDRSTRIVERALNEEVDIFVDYSRGPTDEEKPDSGLLLKLSRTFLDEKWSQHRCVSGLDYSWQHPELVATSYNNNDTAIHDPQGVVLVWNTKFKKTTPEYVFHAQSRITSVAFAKFHPNIVMGGAYSGQIYVWDNRLNKKTPVNKSPLSATAHTHPVYGVQVVGSQNAHKLISVSTDGRLCSWTIDNLNQPQEAIDLLVAWKSSKPVAATCLSFPLNDVNNFFVGSEEGAVYSGCRHGTKAGILEAYEGHFAPVSGIDCHQAVGQVDFSQLFLTSSFDWTVKLWSSKESKPLYSFENHNDYVLDVAWSPVHPALFACIDCQGKLNVWNMNEDTESPLVSLTVEGAPALNKLMWMPSGQQLIVGDDAGKLWLYDVHESVSMPRADEWTRLTRTLADIKQTAQEVEELSQAMNAMNQTISGTSPRAPW